MAQDPYKYFRPEAHELVDQFAKGVLALEKGDAGTAAVQHLLRVAHTLKGAARVVKQAEIAERAHAIEDVLSPYREAAESVSRDEVDVVLQHLDAIGNQLETLDPAAADKSVARDKPEAAVVPRTVRADIAEADAVLEGIAEAQALLGGLRGAAQELGQTRRLFDLRASAPVDKTAPPDARNSGFVARSVTANEFRRKLVTVERGLDLVTDQLDRELRQLREATERLRLVSAANLFTALERMVRESARALSKRISFEGKGADVRLDSHVLETVQSALIQIVRNAVAHGIEHDSERIAVGKPATGHVRVNVSRRGRTIVFECSDDGRGVDLDAVERIAKQRGLFKPTSKKSDAEDLMQLLMRGGISTSAAVTDASGRGVGLDIVRESVERLGGEVAFHTRAGAGTTFKLIVPLSVASMDALFVDAGESGDVCAIPSDCVRRTLRISADQISLGASHASILFEGCAIPFVSLSGVLDGKKSIAGRSWTVVVVSAADGSAAIGVERLLGMQSIVVRPLPIGLPGSPIAAGAWLDADGNPRLVIDADNLVAAAYESSSIGLDAPPPNRPILVVDDSMTTRMLEKSILESAGHNVDVALSGEEALDRVRKKRPALILVDVEMPGMDGFTFIEHIRSDPSLHDTPAILVSSRAAPEDLQRGRDVGAQGYIVKSEFNQAKLLSMINELVG